MDAARSMRRDWDERARKDAFYYIASWRKNWDPAAFLRSGEEDYERLVAPLLHRTGFDTEAKTAIELGCGAGRMTYALAAHFGHVVAFDVSEEMLKRAKMLLHDSANITWLHSNGKNLREAADESADLVFSYLVLQHLPEEELVCDYVREMFRVLRRDGLCLFQFNGSKRSTMNWKGHLAWRVLDTLWAIHARAISRSLARFAGLDPEMVGKSWHGTSITATRVAQTVCAAGGTMVEMTGENTAMAWCCARKSATRSGGPARQ